MVRWLFIIGFVVVGLALWYIIPLLVMNAAQLLGGKLGDALRGGEPGLMVIWFFLIPGAILGSLLNALLGNWASGANQGAPDYSFYVVALCVLCGIPFVVTSFGLCLIASAQP